jgi:protein SCO1/2
VLLTFGYSRCPNPDYCYRLSNNLGKVERRFSSRAGRDLVLVTIAIDPEHDQGAALSQYAAAFHADPAVWHFLTGPLPDIKQVAGMFGMNFWRDEGLLTHSLHTVVIGREGNLAANLEGNQFTAQQLGDLVKTEMNRQ